MSDKSDNNSDNNNLKQCLFCGKSFVPNTTKQKFCCTKHKDVMKQRKYRLHRKLSGRCPQCGKQMDFPVSKHRTKDKISYCTECRRYFKEHREKKLESIK